MYRVTLVAIAFVLSLFSATSMAEYLMPGNVVITGPGITGIKTMSGSFSAGHNPANSNMGRVYALVSNTYLQVVGKDTNDDHVFNCYVYSYDPAYETYKDMLLKLGNGSTVYVSYKPGTSVDCTSIHIINASQLLH